MNTYFALYMFFYTAFSVFTYLHFINYKPLPETLGEDYLIYERAMRDALQGASPYAIADIGPAYIYPPQALLAIDLFSRLGSFQWNYALYIAVNLVLLWAMVTGVLRKYGHNPGDHGYVYVLVFVFSPFLELLHIGQINVVVMYGIWLMFASGGKPFVGGAGLALAGMIKISPVVFAGYLLVRGMYRHIAVMLAAIGIATLAALSRYGPGPFTEFLPVFQGLTDVFIIDINSQALASKLAALASGASGNVSDFPGVAGAFFAFALDFLKVEYSLVHKIIVGYIIMAFLISSALTLRGRLDHEYLFIVTSLGMVLSSNIIWYHHYVFLLLPMLVWLGYTNFNRLSSAWILGGMLIIQIDRFLLTNGLLIQLHAHASLLLILWLQFMKYQFKKMYNE